MKAKENNFVVQIYNCSRQMIPIVVRPPGGDFFLHEQTIYLRPGKTVRLPKSFLNDPQIVNLSTKRMIRILHDSELQFARKPESDVLSSD
jgi:hypothetical protein